jgi:uncharacterized protein with PQ loop repeat
MTELIYRYHRLEDPYETNTAELVFGTALIVLIGISYCFQYSLMIKKRDVSDISAAFLFIGNVSIIAAVTNCIIFYFVIIKECNQMEPITCYGKMLGLISLLMEFLCFGIFYSLYVILHAITNNVNDFFKDIRCTGLAVAGILDLTFIALAIYCVSGYDWNGHKSEGVILFAKICGYVSSALVAIQFVPQIIKLYFNKRTESLSLWMLGLTMLANLGSFLYLLIQNIGDITTMLTYIISVGLQLVISCQIIYYRYLGSKVPELRSLIGDNSIDPQYQSIGINSIGINSIGINSIGINSIGINSIGINSIGINSIGINT